MRAAKIILGSLAAASLFSAAAIAQQTAQQTMTGVITKIDRLNGTMAIRQMQDGTVGANTGAPPDLKVQDSQWLENYHAGDRVTYAIGDNAGAKTITKLEKE